MGIVLLKKFNKSCDDEIIKELKNWYYTGEKPSFINENSIGVYELSKPIGQGQTARAFKIDEIKNNSDNSYYKSTFKEFFPKAKIEENYYELLDDDRNFIHQYSEHKSQFEKRLESFVNAYDVILEFINNCKNKNIEPLEPELFFSSIGVCYLTKFKNGETLDCFFNKCSIIESLKICKETLFDVKTYHQFGYMHADVKPENLLIGDSNNSDEINKKVVRSVDFSSIIKFDSLLQKISEYLSNAFDVEDIIEDEIDDIIDDIIDNILPFFESTKKYYSYEVIENLLGQLIIAIKDNETSAIEFIKNCFFALDIVAGIKMFFGDGLKLELPEACDKQKINQEISKTKKRIMDKFAHEKGFKSYHKGYLLVELLEKYYNLEETCKHDVEDCDKNIVFSLIEKREDFIDIEQILEEIIKIFEDDTTLVYNHCNYGEYDYLLGEEKTVNDIVELSIDLFNGKIESPIKIIEHLMYE